ncbi:ABC transporter permease [Paenibacillus sp. P96]|uniref:ABC transporter permease n=1 Tax=Paenibacillus zeirhizosphaerae TaxID=2987519 RepID=A0ABT9FTQ9_9BACL|nr:ABC transporter permease [Paenibacillus sp. P96]MDP4098122.1 ABC transporter permease [Paenibacillus sp. P96]
MVDLLAVELLKLKRSKMLLLSMIGAGLAPFMVVLAFYINRTSADASGEQAVFETLFYNTSMYTVLLIGVPLYSIVAAYLFLREYTEDTLKNLLTIPVSRTGLMISKMLLLLVWILLLSLVAWALTILCGLLGGFDGLSGALILDYLIKFAVEGALLWALTTPVILVTIVMKNYVPSMIAAISITMLNVLVFNSEHRGLVPWTAAFDITHQSLLPLYPAELSYLSIAGVSLVGFASILIYFGKVDIH